MLQTPDIPSIPLPIWIMANNHFSCRELGDIATNMQTKLDEKNTFFRTLNPVLRIVHEGGSSQCGEDINSLAEIEPAMVLQLELTHGEYSLSLIPGTDTALIRVPTTVPGSVARHLADSLYQFFVPEQVLHALLLKSQSVQDPSIDDFLNAQPPGSVEQLEQQLARAAKPSPAYHLTFSLFSATGAPSSWEVQKALDIHVRPLIGAVAAIADIDVATQVQLYSSYSPSIKPVQEDNEFYIQQKDLTAFVNAAEWPLSPSIGLGPTLNFIVYVPNEDQIPLGIECSSSHGWLVPQWGAISILNPTLTSHTANGRHTLPLRLSEDNLRPAFDSFASQLVSLLGIPEFTGHHSLPLRLRAYKRFMGLALSSKASSGLASLARVAGRLQQIPIPKHVAQLVDTSLANITAFTAASKEARWNDAVEHAADAYVDSEKAFFDKSMVGQVYFPDEHKVAVYLPLLGPIGVPLLVGLLREVKRFVTMRKSS